jgi:hypothetical protein
MSQSDLLYHSLDRMQVRKLLAKFFSLYKEGKAFIHLTDHFKERCVSRNVNMNDAINVMKAGSIHKQGEPHIKTGQIIYNIETATMEVSFQVLDENRIRLITIKRK